MPRRPLPPEFAAERARRARRLPVEVQVRFASSPGSLETLEGPVRYSAGAALVTGKAGDRWPVERAHFEASYEPLPGTPTGRDGRYRKRPAEVAVWRLTAPFSIEVGIADDPLRGRPGDWLVGYGPDHYGIVAAELFAASYELLDEDEGAIG